MPTPTESARIRANIVHSPVGRSEASYHTGEYRDPDKTAVSELPLPDQEFVDWAKLQGGTEELAKVAHAKYLKQFENFAIETLKDGVRGAAPKFKTRREIFMELHSGGSVQAGGYLIIEWRIRPAGPQSDVTAMACGCGCGCGCGG